MVLDVALRATIAAALTTVAPAMYLDVDLVRAVSYRELIDGRLVSEPNADGSRDWGAMQVNDAVFGRYKVTWGGKWLDVTPQDLVDTPVLGVEAGCIILRWRVREALLAEGLVIRDYPHMAQVLAGMTPQARRGIYYRAVAAYRGGDEAMRDWPNVDPVTMIYAGAVLREYDRLRGAGRPQ